MRTQEVVLLSGFAGALVGGVLTYYSTKGRIEDRANQRLSEEIREVREYYRAKAIKEEPASHEPEKQPEVSEEPPVSRPTERGKYNDYQEALNDYDPEEDYEELRREAPADDGESFSEEEIEEAVVNPEPRKNLDARIRLLTTLEWDENEWDYERVYLNFYPEDQNIVTDSMDVPIDDPEPLIGVVSDYVVGENEDVQEFMIVNHDKRLLISLEKNVGTFVSAIMGVRNVKDPVYGLKD